MSRSSQSSPSLRTASRAGLSPVQLAALREQLEEQRRFRIEQLDELRAVDPTNTGDVTDVLAAGARAALRDVLAALHRIEVGSYGSCTDCGTRLPIERLEILPQVGRCLSCSRADAARAGR